MWTMGAAAGTARGYDCLTFDSSGQGKALWKQGFFFCPDREKVITRVVHFALTLDGVDPTRIAPRCISQGRYWVPSARRLRKVHRRGHRRSGLGGRVDLVDCDLAQSAER